MRVTEKEQITWIVDQTRIDAAAVEVLYAAYARRFGWDQEDPTFIRTVLYGNLRAWREMEEG